MPFCVVDFTCPTEPSKLHEVQFASLRESILSRNLLNQLEHHLGVFDPFLLQVFPGSKHYNYKKIEFVFF